MLVYKNKIKSVTRQMICYLLFCLFYQSCICIEGRFEEYAKVWFCFITHPYVQPTNHLKIIRALHHHHLSSLSHSDGTVGFIFSYWLPISSPFFFFKFHFFSFHRFPFSRFPHILSMYHQSDHQYHQN